MKNYRLMALLHDRGLNHTILAERIGSSRSHVCQVLLNKAGRGYRTRKKLAPLLTPFERHLLGWSDDGRLFHGESSNSKKTPTPILDTFRIHAHGMA